MLRRGRVPTKPPVSLRNHECRYDHVASLLHCRGQVIERICRQRVTLCSAKRQRRCYDEQRKERQTATAEERLQRRYIAGTRGNKMACSYVVCFAVRVTTLLVYELRVGVIASQERKERVGNENMKDTRMEAKTARRQRWSREGRHKRQKRCYGDMRRLNQARGGEGAAANVRRQTR